MSVVNPHLARAELLLSQERFDLAEGHARQALAADPGEPTAHAYLALCLINRAGAMDEDDGRPLREEALSEARAAVGLAPDDPYPHYVLSAVCSARNMEPEALEAANESIRLDPERASYWARLAAVHIDSKRFREALDAAKHGLSLDPDHTGCINLEAIALRGLGKKDAATASAASALSRNPDDADSHANLGWALLNQGKYAQAQTHFREALRLRPGSEWARQGMIESLKARWFIYRIFLAYFLFMVRLGERAQWGIILGGYLGYQIIGAIGRSNPAFKPFTTPLIVAYIAFAVGTWLAVPLFNLSLRVSRFGRLILSRRQTIAANALGLTLLAAIGSAIAWAATGADGWEFTTLIIAPLAVPIAITGMASDRVALWIMLALTGALTLLGAFLLAAGLGVIPVPEKLFTPLISPYMLGCILSVIAGNLAGSLTNNRRK